VRARHVGDPLASANGSRGFILFIAKKVGSPQEARPILGDDLMKRVAFLSLAIGLAILSSNVQAGVLFKRTLRINRSTNNFESNQFDFDLSFALGSLFSPTDSITLFDDLIISPADADVLATFDATSSNDASFLDVADRITDGLGGVIFYAITEAPPTGFMDQRGLTESSFFFNGTPSTSPDLVGSIVDRISLTIDLFTLLPKGTGGPGNPEVDLQMTIKIHGTAIPEPAAGWLFLCGLVAMGAVLYLGRARACHFQARR